MWDRGRGEEGQKAESRTTVRNFMPPWQWALGCPAARLGVLLRHGVSGIAGPQPTMLKTRHQCYWPLPGGAPLGPTGSQQLLARATFEDLSGHPLSNLEPFSRDVS